MTQYSGDAMGNELRQWYKDHGVCPTCGQRDAFPGRVQCAECLEKSVLNNIKYRDPKAATYNERYRERNKEKREARKNAGLCIRCGKPATRGQLCDYHYSHKRELREKEKATRTRPGEVFRARLGAGTCMYCGKEVAEGFKFCHEHLREVQQRDRTRCGEKWRKEISRMWIAKSLSEKPSEYKEVQDD